MTKVAQLFDFVNNYWFLVFKKNAFKKPTSFGCLGKIMNV
jgi:hypothetical protein